MHLKKWFHPHPAQSMQLCIPAFHSLESKSSGRKGLKDKESKSPCSTQASINIILTWPTFTKAERTSFRTHPHTKKHVKTTMHPKHCRQNVLQERLSSTRMEALSTRRTVRT